MGLAMLDALYKRDTYTNLWSIQAYRIRHEYQFIVYCDGYNPFLPHMEKTIIYDLFFKKSYKIVDKVSSHEKSQYAGG